MSASPIVHATFVMEKPYPHKVDKVFKAFSDTATKTRWLMPPGGEQQPGYAHEQDFRNGGLERNRWVMGPETPFPGAVISSEGLFLDILEGRRIVSGSNMMMNGAPFSASLLTFEFDAAGDGTRLVLTHTGAFFENSDGPEMREDGWRKLFERLDTTLSEGA